MARRKVTYGLVAVGIALILAVGWFLLRARATHLEDSAINLLRASGAEVEVDPAPTFLGVRLIDPEIGITFHSATINASSLRQIGRVSTLGFVGCKVSGDIIGQLHRPKTVKVLSIWDGTIDETASAELGKLSGIESVFFLNVSVRDDILAALARLEHLTTLSLSNTETTDDGLKNLQTATMLVDLNLSRNPINGTGLAWLAGLRRLTDLNLARCPVEEAKLHHLAAVPSLRAVTLTLDSCKGEVLQSLAGVPNIDILNLTDRTVTDDRLMQLQTMKQLRSLCLNDTSVTAKGVKRLKEALPSLDVSIASPVETKH